MHVHTHARTHKTLHNIKKKKEVVASIEILKLMSPSSPNEKIQITTIRIASLEKLIIYIIYFSDSERKEVR